MKDILPLLFGGLVLFLYAISQLSLVLQGIFTERAKHIIEKYTSNIFSALLIGTLLTILLDSSSAVIILLIVFINAQVISFRQSIGLILGANIGTTFSSQIIAMDVGKYSIIPLAFGLLLYIFSPSANGKQYGKVMLYFGMLFFGLFIMEQSVEPLKNSDQFLAWLARVEGSPVFGAMTGGLVTLLIQSSSGTVGMAIVLGKQQIISATGGISVMLGAELGTCSDTLLATINGTRDTLKAGLFHLLFNLSTILLGLLFFHPFVTMVFQLSTTEDIGRIIANAHVLFNILGVLLFLPIFFFWTRNLEDSTSPSSRSRGKVARNNSISNKRVR